MARQNRVNPAGDLIADASRAATLMGNRGCLHDAEGHVVRTSARKAWVSCLLQFKGIQRKVMTPGHYTELFFLDEATALAAGHRPCSTCRRDAAKRFVGHWTRANPQSATAGLAEIDAHFARRTCRSRPRLGHRASRRNHGAPQRHGSVLRGASAARAAMVIQWLRGAHRCPSTRDGPVGHDATQRCRGVG